MATLYVTEQGARLEREYDRILVCRDDDMLMAVPIKRLSGVVLVGRVGATTPALLALLDAGVALSLITRSGQLRGRLTPPSSGNLALRRAQHDRARDAGFCLRLARAIAGGKARNALSLARRLCRNHAACDASYLKVLEHSIAGLPAAGNLAAVRGLEGLASRAYFHIYRQALRPEMAFGARTRRPPRDPVNALLSLGYTLLTHNLIAACEVVGLDPFDGFYHADKYGRPALALDLMEEWRGVIVDSLVQRLVNRRILTPQSFDDDMLLTQRALRRFLRQYALRLNHGVFHPTAGRALSYQRVFELQARQLAKVINEGLDSYRPFRVR